MHPGLVYNALTMSKSAAMTDAPEPDTARRGKPSKSKPAPSPESEAGGDASPAPEHDTLAQRVEAILISVDRPVSSEKISAMLDAVGTKAVNQAIDRLNRFYGQTGRSFQIEPVAKGWRIMTTPPFAELLAGVHKHKPARLSPAAMETLAIIAYKQPILRADIESIRGVASGEVVRGLMDRRLVKIVGRAEEIGRPMLYGTTQAFLETFGLARLKDLPKPEEL